MQIAKVTTFGHAYAKAKSHSYPKVVPMRLCQLYKLKRNKWWLPN